MSNLEIKCPICGHETLTFSQNADIRYKVVDGKLIPQLDEDSIGWMDSKYLYCSHYGANDEDSKRLSDIKFEYENHI